MSGSEKIRVAILFGGQSAEHEISILSARNVLAALDRSRFEPVLIGIDKAGQVVDTGPEEAPRQRAGSAAGACRPRVAGALAVVGRAAAVTNADRRTDRRRVSGTSRY